MINKCGRQLILGQTIENVYAKKSFRHNEVYFQTITSFFNKLSKSCLVKIPEKQNLAWRYSLLFCIQNVIEAKVHDLCVTLVGVASPFI